jgi:hypothetical protein
MSNFTTPEDAQALRCPLARTFGDDKPLDPECQGPVCAVWRWKPISAKDPRFTKAINEEIDRLHAEHKAEHPLSDRKKDGFHQQAVKNVSADREAHGVPSDPELGFCGLGGVPLL